MTDDRLLRTACAILRTNRDLSSSFREEVATMIEDQKRTIIAQRIVDDVQEAASDGWKEKVAALREALKATVNALKNEGRRGGVVMEQAEAAIAATEPETKDE